MNCSALIICFVNVKYIYRVNFIYLLINLLLEAFLPAEKVSSEIVFLA